MTKRCSSDFLGKKTNPLRVWWLKKVIKLFWARKWTPHDNPGSATDFQVFRSSLTTFEFFALLTSNQHVYDCGILSTEIQNRPIIPAPGHRHGHLQHINKRWYKVTHIRNIFSLEKYAGEFIQKIHVHKITSSSRRDYTQLQQQFSNNVYDNARGISQNKKQVSAFNVIQCLIRSHWWLTNGKLITRFFCLCRRHC